MNGKGVLINETIIRDVVDLISDVKSSSVSQAVLSKNPKINNMNSISRASSNLILTFPVLASRSLDISTSNVISKAIERKALSMLQILFSAIVVSNAEDAAEFINTFHTNLDFDGDITVDSFMDVMDKSMTMMEASGKLKVSNERLFNEAKANLKKFNNEIPKFISEQSVNDFVIDDSRIYVKEAKDDHSAFDVFKFTNSIIWSRLKKDTSDSLKAIFSSKTSITDKFSSFMKLFFRLIIMDLGTIAGAVAGSPLGPTGLVLGSYVGQAFGMIAAGFMNGFNSKEDFDIAIKETNHTIQEAKNKLKEVKSKDEKEYLNKFINYCENTIIKDLKNRKSKVDSKKTMSTFSKVTTGQYFRENTPLDKNSSSINKSEHDILRNRLVDSDVKKANELSPSLMIVNFVSNASGTAIVGRAIIGVKAKLYPVNSEDIITQLSSKYKDDNTLLSLIKATSGEISFWKDFVFALDKAKLDALSNSKKGSSSPLWKLLERRSLKSRVRRMIGLNNTGAAISTLVLSIEEVEYLKKSFNINLERPKEVNVIIDAFNLMCLAIVNEANEYVSFYFDDNQNAFETVSFRQLERDSSNGGDLKKMINLMTKVAR